MDSVVRIIFALFGLHIAATGQLMDPWDTVQPKIWHLSADWNIMQMLNFSFR